MSMSNPDSTSDWGVKRVCPETGKRFYDLHKTPIVSPYTGKIVPVEAHDRREEAGIAALKAKAAKKVDDDDDLLVDDEDDAVEVDDELLEDDDDDTVALDDLADVATDDDD
jgi:uncharacterized protein (TIGR02300 family)